MQTKVQKWGNSLAIRIPKTYAKDMNITGGSSVDISRVESKIIIEPVKGEKYHLKDLLIGITKKNVHGEVLGKLSTLLEQ